MTETTFFEAWWRFITPCLILVGGTIIGCVATILAPISDEEKKKAAKEIEEGISRFADEFTRPFNGLGMIGLRVMFFYIIGMFTITILGAMLADILNLPSIYDPALRIVAAAAEYLPTITFIIVMVYLGQETGKVMGVLFKWSGKLIIGVKKIFNLVEKEETER